MAEPTFAPSIGGDDAPQAVADNTHQGALPWFNLDEFFTEAENKIKMISAAMLRPPDFDSRPDPLDVVLTDTLLCLEDSEWKYLPLWAGGNDDGSGGVFDDSVPLAEAGVSAAVPGPGFHTGLSSRGSSEYELIDEGQATSSTFHTSTVVNDGLSEQLDRRRVFEADSLWDQVMADKSQTGGSSTAGASEYKGGFDGNSEWSEVEAAGNGGSLATNFQVTSPEAADVQDNTEMMDDVWNDDDKTEDDDTGSDWASDSEHGSEPDML